MFVSRKTALRKMVAVGDTATIIIAFVGAYATVGHLLHRRFGPFAEYAWLPGVIVPVWLTCLWAFGLYRSASYATFRGMAGRLAKAHCVAGLVFLSTMYLTKSEAVSRLLLQSFLTIGFLALAVQKFGLRAWLRRRNRIHVPYRHRVLLVSTPHGAQQYAELIRSHASMNAELVGMLTIAPADGELNGTDGDIPSISGQN